MKLNYDIVEMDITPSAMVALCRSWQSPGTSLTAHYLQDHQNADMFQDGHSANSSLKINLLTWSINPSALAMASLIDNVMSYCVENT